MKNVLTRLMIVCLLLTAGKETIKSQVPLRVKQKQHATFKLKAPFLEDVFEMPSGGYWSMSQRNETRYVALYDKNFNFKKGRYIYFEFANKDLDLVKIIQNGDDFYFFLGFTNEKLRKQFIFYTSFNPETLEMGDDLYKVGQVPIPKKDLGKKYFQVTRDKDNKFVMIAGIHPKGSSNGDQESRFSSGTLDAVTMSFWVLNRDMQIINYIEDHEMILEDDATRFIFRDFMVGTDGAIYVLGKNEHITKVGRRKSETQEVKNSSFILEQVLPDGEVNQYVTEQEVMYNDMRILMGDSNKIEMIGLLAEEYEGFLISNGADRTTLDSDGLGLLNYVETYFTEDVLKTVNNVVDPDENRSNSRKRSKKSKKESREDQIAREIAKLGALEMQVIREVALDAMGNPVMLMEERSLRIVTTTTTSSNGSSSTRTTYYYNYDDALLVRFDDQEGFQAPIAKNYTAINQEIVNPILLFASDEYITVMLEDNVVRYDLDLIESTTKDIVAGARGGGKRAKSYHLDDFVFKKSMPEGFIAGAHQKQKKITWYKVTLL